MVMFDFLNRMFSREPSKDIAKDRLKLVLVHDRANTSPDLLAEIKEELITVISNYMEIDERGIEVELSTKQDSVALIASIPVKRVKRGSIRVR